MFQNTQIEYRIVEKQIILTKKTLSSTSSLKVQAKEIKGTVTDSSGQPLPGASIIIKGTSIGTTTDFDGKFSLEVEGDSAILVVSYIGFLTKEVIIDAATEYNITLNADAQSLDEVTLLGSRAKPRSNFGESSTC